MQFRSVLAAAALALTLAGCWKSQAPLMAAADRDPVELTGTWSDLGDGGSSPTVYRMIPGTDGQIMAQKKMPSGWMDAYRLSFDWLDSETWLLQAVDNEGKPVYQLLLGDPDDDELKLVTLHCTVQVLNSHREIQQDDGDCVFSTYPVLRERAEQAAEKVAAGESYSYDSIVTYHRVED